MRRSTFQHSDFRIVKIGIKIYHSWKLLDHTFFFFLPPLGLCQVAQMLLQRAKTIFSNIIQVSESADSMCL